MSAEYSLKEFRKIIRKEWVPLVGRRDLTSYEYTLTKEWFDASTSISTVLRAIRDCAARASQKGTTVYSLGVISGDLARIQRESRTARLGAHQTKGDWRAGWRDDLEQLALETSDPERAAAYRELITSLPSLPREEAEKQFKELAQWV